MLSVWWPLAGVAAAAGVAVGPIGLIAEGPDLPAGLDPSPPDAGRGVGRGLEVVVVAAGVLLGPAAPVAVLAAVAVPVLVDLACLVTSPVERRLGTRFVDEASTRLARVHPTVVAVTGSYGKTSTKGHIAHLVRPTRTVVATPASFNNRAGLARAVNEHLADGTEVFVAEMGTYGPGEIAELCEWCPPDIAVITAIGPVHLERFGSEDRIVEAKSEILVSARRRRAPGGRPPARRRGRSGRRPGEAGPVGARPSTGRPMSAWCGRRTTPRCRSTSPATRWSAKTWPCPPGPSPPIWPVPSPWPSSSGSRPATVGQRLADLPSVDHRLQAARSGSGVAILDDTYNANPAGAAEALEALRLEAPDPTGPHAGAGRVPSASAHRRAVVTPGMVELGPRQFAENRALRAAIAGVADHLVIVGRTNRRALLAGVTVGRRHAAHPGGDPGGPPRPGRGLGAGAPRPGGRRVVRERSSGPLPLTR